MEKKKTRSLKSRLQFLHVNPQSVHILLHVATERKITKNNHRSIRVTTEKARNRHELKKNIQRSSRNTVFHALVWEKLRFYHLQQLISVCTLELITSFDFSTSITFLFRARRAWFKCWPRRQRFLRPILALFHACFAYENSEMLTAEVATFSIPSVSNLNSLRLFVTKEKCWVTKVANKFNPFRTKHSKIELVSFCLWQNENVELQRLLCQSFSSSTQFTSCERNREGGNISKSVQHELNSPVASFVLALTQTKCWLQR